MPVVAVVLDTAALLAYARGSHVVGQVLITTADRGETVVVLAAAYRDVRHDGWNLLDVLAGLNQESVAPLEHEHCAGLGGWARTLGLDRGHAAIEAASRPVTPLMTANRLLIMGILPTEWPIIDV